MESVQLTGTGFNAEGIPVFVFNATLADGRDFDGKFRLRFALARLSPERVAFVVSDEQEQNILGAVRERDTHRVIEALLTHEEWIVCINYENTAWSPAEGVVEVPLLGRVQGDDYDWQEHRSLGPDNLDAIKEMRTQLQNLDNFTYDEEN